MCLQVAITHNLLIGFIIIVLKNRRAPMPLLQGWRPAYKSIFFCDLIIFTVHFDNPLRLFAFSGFSDLQRVFSVAVFRRVKHRRVFRLSNGFYRLDRFNNLLRGERWLGYEFR